MGSVNELMVRKSSIHVTLFAVLDKRCLVIESRNPFFAEGGFALQFNVIDEDMLP
jgi:hypothetical protein